MSATLRGSLLATLALAAVGSLVAASDAVESYPLAEGQFLRYLLAAAILVALARGRLPRLSLREALGLSALAATGLVLFNFFVVEGVRDKRVLTDGTRTVEIHHIAGNLHADGLLMVYLPREKLLSQADTFTPSPPNAPPPSVVNASTVNLADNLARLGLVVDQHLPLHGRIVPAADLLKATGR